LALAAILRDSRVTMADSIGRASLQIAGLRPSLEFPAYHRLRAPGVVKSP